MLFDMFNTLANSHADLGIILFQEATATLIKTSSSESYNMSVLVNTALTLLSSYLETTKTGKVSSMFTCLLD
jgi:hypothetical protein